MLDFLSLFLLHPSFISWPTFYSAFSSISYLNVVFLEDQLLAYFSVLYMYTLSVLNTEYSLISLSHVKSHYEVNSISCKSPLGIANINIQIDIIMLTVFYQYVYSAISVCFMIIQFLSYILDFFLCNSLFFQTNFSPNSIASGFWVSFEILPCCFVISFLICNNISQNSVFNSSNHLQHFFHSGFANEKFNCIPLFVKSSIELPKSSGKAQSFLVRQERQSRTQHVFTLFVFITSHCFLCTFGPSLIESFAFLLLCCELSLL